MFLERGILVAVEGIDGAGKTTQVELLCRRLSAAGFHVFRTKEPTNGPDGQKLRASARAGRLPPGEELALFLADRGRHVREEIAPQLAAGVVVVVDRYYFSTIAYQGARGLDVRDLQARNEAIAPRPDLLLLVDVPVEEGLRRITQGRGEVADAFETRESLAATQRIFRAMDFPYLVRLDGLRPAAELHRAAVAALVDGPLRERLCPLDPARCRATGCEREAERDCPWAVLRDVLAATEAEVLAAS